MRRSTRASTAFVKEHLRRYFKHRHLFEEDQLPFREELKKRRREWLRDTIAQLRLMQGKTRCRLELKMKMCKYCGSPLVAVSVTITRSGESVRARCAKRSCGARFLCTQDGTVTTKEPKGG